MFIIVAEIDLRVCLEKFKFMGISRGYLCWIESWLKGRKAYRHSR